MSYQHVFDVEDEKLKGIEAKKSHDKTVRIAKIVLFGVFLACGVWSITILACASFDQPLFDQEELKRIFECTCVTDNSKNVQTCDLSSDPSRIQLICYLNSTECCIEWQTRDGSRRCLARGVQPSICRQEKYLTITTKYVVVVVLTVLSFFVSGISIFSSIVDKYQNRLPNWTGICV